MRFHPLLSLRQAGLIAAERRPAWRRPPGGTRLHTPQCQSESASTPRRTSN